MTISFIAAASENDVIGKEGKLPWSLPDDLRYFKNTTWGLPVIMGRKTYESFTQMLKGRTILIITRNNTYAAEDAIVVKDVQEGIIKAEALKTAEIFIIGGGEIFRESLPLANRIYMTRVHTVVEGDAYFPRINAAEWQLVSTRLHPKDEKHAFDFSFEIWERIRNNY